MVRFDQLKEGLVSGELVPVLGAGALQGAVDPSTQEPMPADSRSLILAMNGGREMMPRLMYEFSRAAQHLEQRRGQAAVTRFLTQLYGRRWTRSPLHQALADLAPHWVVDLNRDSQLLESYAGQPHLLIKGVSRIMEKAKRFQLFKYDGQTYAAIDEAAADASLPILFKPLGCCQPEPGFIASDADFVDYLTELMGGFAIPSFLKQYRPGRQYLLLGVPLSRDTERMLVTEISYGASEPRGWVFLPEATAKEQRFCARMGLQIIDRPLAEFTAYLLGGGENGSQSMSAM
ncbi:SIR2 family protein [Motiliproteus sediminis]|uniref:SIR2 family protein n=1 Tax=Motiliproteus sediminis TaxID=1468178 RepID=UPI001AEFCFF1|nr:SIR2 family protein [Motiliproteus sediminis]